MGCVEIIAGYLFPQLQSGVEAGFSFLQNLVAGRILNLINLGKNARTLAQEMKQLTDLRDDLLLRVEMEEEVRPRMRRTRQVAGWIERVEQLEGEVGDFRASFEGRTTLLEGCSFGSVRSNYELGQKAADRLGRVGELKSQGGSYLGGGELVVEGPPDAVVPVPSLAPRIVGGEKILSEIRRHLKEDDGVGIIGVYGMGGAGKTTYLTEINNEFLIADEPRRTTNDFEVVIWVTVSKDVDISRIQEDIGVRLGYSRPGQGPLTLPEDEFDRRDTLYRALRRKSKFLLLLDDLWEELDLEKIGIPRRPPANQSTAKVVFTTRSKEVCVKMEAQKMLKVDCLDDDESWELFSLKVGAEVDLNRSGPSIRRLAEKVVRRCGGLPLALVTVGHAMAGAVTIDEWEDAVAKLREAPEEIQDVEKEVLSILKFSFDKLRDDSLRHCLLYCSLYPEDHEIDAGEIIEYWVGEGFLDTKRSRGLDAARRKGREVIRSLKAACLLESAERRSWGGELVKMHDVVRDMALWLTNGEHVGGEGSIRVQDIDRWEGAKRTSFFPRDWWDNVELPTQVPTCPNLETLLLRRVNIKQLECRDGFIFKFMPALRVLDLSRTRIEELPKEIGLLVSLQYLNLQATSLRSLPRELGNLAKLRQLNLGGVLTLESIPGDAILRLAELQMLNTFGSDYGVSCEPLITETGADDHDRGDITLRGMERALGRLEELGIDVKTSESLEGLVTSNHLSKCTRFLGLNDVSGLTASQLSRAFERLQGLREMHLADPAELEELSFGGGNQQLQYLEVLILSRLGQARILVPPPPHSHLLPRLRELQIWYSRGFKDLTWIQHLPCLETVELHGCRGLEELLLQAEEAGDEAEACSSSVTRDNSFPSMKVMSFFDLPRLRTLRSGHPLLLPSLEELYVIRCPELRKLPFGAHSAKKLRILSGSQEWWNGLEWGQDSSIKDIFLDNFRPR